jgi:peroxiredoxin
MMKNIIFLLFSFLTFSSFSPQSGYNIGDVASDFSLKNIDDKMVSLANIDAKGFVIVFTCNHCPFSVMYEDRIISLSKKTEKLGYPLVAINSNDDIQYPDDSFENMKIRAKEKGFDFPYLRDDSQEIAKKYGALRTPHIYIVKREGKDLKVKYIGAIDDNAEDATAVKNKYVENAVIALSKNEKISPETTKAIGCTIKWKK